MHSTSSFFSLFAFLLSTASAASHDVLVGNDGFSYSPNSFKAAKGDTVVFHFYPGNHDVVQGNFDSPCSNSGGFYSGFVDSESGASGTTFTITIADTNPIWIYCSQINHCQQGMAMVINPPSSGDTLSAYITAAGKTTSSNQPDNVQGGVVSSGEGSGEPSSSASSAVASSATGSHASSHASSSVSTAGTSGSPASSTPASSLASQTSTSSTTSASASPTKNSASVVGKDVVLGGITSIVAVVAFWIGLV